MMVSITMNVKDDFKQELKAFSWINWSEIARIEAMKKKIFEDFLKTRKLSKEDENFCEGMDWHPVDELPLKESFVKELKRIQKGPHHKMTLKELDELMGLK